MRSRRLVGGAVAVLVLAGGLLAGLGAGSAPAGDTAGAKARSTTTAPSLPMVTAVTTPTVPSTSLPGHNRPQVLLGDMNTPEQFILGQLYQLALEQEGFNVHLTRNVGEQWVRQQALKLGTLDLYPEYLGEWNSQVAHLHRRFRTLAGSYAAGSAYARRHGFVLLNPTPFSNTSGVAVTTQYAQQNRVRSIADLAHRTGIIFGSPLEFESIADGLPALTKAYHLDPGYVQTIGVGLQYWWLNTGNVEAAYSSTTDPQLAGPSFVELQDPKHVFGFGNVVPVTTQHVVKTEGPDFVRTINRVDALLTEQAMRGLNSEIMLGNHSPTQIAEQFLEGNGILPPSRFAPVTSTGGGT